MSKYGEVKSIKPNPFLKGYADILRKGQEYGNYVDIPYVGGLGDLLFGDAQEATEGAAYGFPPTKGQGLMTQIKPGAFDAATYLTGPAGLAAKGGKMTLDKLRRLQKQQDEIPSMLRPQEGVMDEPLDLQEDAPLEELMKEENLPMFLRKQAGFPDEEEVIDMSRRDFLKKSAALGGGAAVASSIPGGATVLKKTLAKPAADAAKVAATKLPKIYPGVAGASSILNAMAKISGYNIGKKLIPSDFEGTRAGIAAMRETEKSVDDWIKARGYEGQNMEPKGFGERYLGMIPENDTAFASAAERAKLSSKQSRELHNIAGDAMEEYATKTGDDALEYYVFHGKWPKGYEDKMKWFDPDYFGEYNITSDGSWPSLVSKHLGNTVDDLSVEEDEMVRVYNTVLENWGREVADEAAKLPPRKQRTLEYYLRDALYEDRGSKRGYSDRIPEIIKKMLTEND